MKEDLRKSVAVFSKAGLKTRDYISVSIRCNIIYIAKKKKKKATPSVKN